jgi:hypothetical protein
MAQAQCTPRLDRTARAAGIVSRREVTPVDDMPGLFHVRDTATGSGTVHIASAQRCDCMDGRRAHLACKHRIAVAAEERELAAYAASWDLSAALQQPRCGVCSSPLESRSYYVGGKGYQYVIVCSDDATHSNGSG